MDVPVSYLCASPAYTTHLQFMTMVVVFLPLCDPLAYDTIPRSPRCVSLYLVESPDHIILTCLPLQLVDRMVSPTNDRAIRVREDLEQDRAYRMLGCVATDNPRQVISREVACTAHLLIPGQKRKRSLCVTRVNPMYNFANVGEQILCEQ